MLTCGHFAFVFDQNRSVLVGEREFGKSNKFVCVCVFLELRVINKKYAGMENYSIVKAIAID